jgi:hypothetical protein
MHTNIINKHFSKSDKIQDFHMIVDDDPVVVDESIKFSFNNVNNEVVLVNNTSTLSTDTCIVALYKDLFPPIFHLKTAVTFLILHPN